MESNVLARTGTGRPSLFDTGWFDKFFNAPVDEFFSTRTVNVPAVNVTEKEKEYLLEIGAPGLKKEDFNISVDDDIITISAEKEKEEKDESSRYNRREYNYTSWSRSFTLPENGMPNLISANYKDGELLISIPKKSASETKTMKTIAVQ